MPKAPSVGVADFALVSSYAKHEVVRYRASGRIERPTDLVAVEAPLKIVIDGANLATTMRTPGHDEELAVGFLLSEGIIDSRTRAIDTVVNQTDTGSTVEVRLGGDQRSLRDASLLRRGSLTTSACGVCARDGIADLLERCRPVVGSESWDPNLIARLPGLLRANQHAFDLTGGLHAAAVAGLDGEVTCLREDVGRHNAVDKVFGRTLLDGDLPATDRALVVSGRSSFEIVQKAAAAGVALVVSVSAPSSLAIDIARHANITLVGFVRDQAFNIYTHPNRIAPP